MFIKKLSIHNFKGFYNQDAIEFGIPDGQTPGSGLNILVGENNTGKSTLFEAIYFLRNNSKKEINELKFKTICSDITLDEQISVTGTFVGDISKTAEVFAEKKFQTFSSHIETTEDPIFPEAITVQRSGTNVKALKEIKLQDIQSKDFDNVTGIDAPFKALLDLNIIWADTNPQDEAKFGSTSLCGSLLKAISSNCRDQVEFQALRNSFDNVFNDDGSGLRQEIKNIEVRLNELFKKQFSDSEIHFSFDFPTSDVFFKNVKIQLSNGERTTDLSEEGMGLQRGVALTLLQVYAEIVSKNSDKTIQKPFIFFIDEPEICLHPLGQKKLLESLLTISKKQQVFITTHSPFFLEGPTLHNATLIICKKNNDRNELIQYKKEKNKLLPWSPSWGEICFIAYNLPTVDLHNELYGYLQYHSNNFTEKDFEKWLTTNGFPKYQTWTRENPDGTTKKYEVTLQTFIRNKIHHPENKAMANEEYSDEQLFTSINEMIGLIRRLNNVGEQ